MSMGAPKKYRVLDTGPDGLRDIVRLNEQDREEKIAAYRLADKTIVLENPASNQWRVSIGNALQSERLAWEHWAVSGQQDEPKLAKSPPIPKKPSLSPKFGDKTPAYVEWLQKYFPHDFKIRYGVIGYATQSRPRIDGAGNRQFDRVTGLPVMDIFPHVLVAHRKTHLTEVPNGTEVWDEGQEIDLNGGES